MPGRNITINYAPFEKFTAKACSIVSIDMPDLQKTSKIVEVKSSKDNSMLRYHTIEREALVSCNVVFSPLDTSEGKALIPHVKELTEEILKDTYEPKTATITLFKKDGKGTEEIRHIDRAVITSGAITIARGESIEITFTLQGLLQRDL
jgi:hypothetical protein